MTSTESNRAHWLRPTAGGGVLAVLASIVLSIVAYGVLGESARIRWNIGSTAHFGPETVSSVFLLAVFPLLLIGAFIGFRVIKRYLDTSEPNTELSRIFEVVVLLGFAMIFTAQLAFILLNLVFP